MVVATPSPSKIETVGNSALLIYEEPELGEWINVTLQGESMCWSPTTFLIPVLGENYVSITTTNSGFDGCYIPP